MLDERPIYSVNLQLRATLLGTEVTLLGSYDIICFQRKFHVV